MANDPIKKLEAEIAELKARLAESEKLWDMEFQIVAKLVAELQRTQGDALAKVQRVI